MSGGFQTSVNTNPAPAVAGDWASTNPRFMLDAGPGGMVAGTGGITVGRFCWLLAAPLDANYAPQQVVNFGASSSLPLTTAPAVAGIVTRSQQGLNTVYLADASMLIPAGFMVTVCAGGDVWVKNDGTGQALVGQKAYASLATGKVSFSGTGAASTASSNASSVAAATYSVTASMSGNTLTVTALSSGTVTVGSFVYGTVGGSGVIAGTQVISQLSGTVGGVGVYLVSIGEQSVGSGTLSGTYGLFTVGGTVTGTYAVGAVLTSSGTAATAGTVITALGTGTGGAGTYIVQFTQTINSTTITGTTNVETKWFATSSGAAGDLVKISSHVLG